MRQVYSPFSLCLLVDRKPTKCVPPPAVKCTRVRYNITNLKAERWGSGEGQGNRTQARYEAIIPNMKTPSICCYGKSPQWPPCQDSKCLMFDAVRGWSGILAHRKGEMHTHTRERERESSWQTHPAQNVNNARHLHLTARDPCAEYEHSTICPAF